MFKRHDEHVAMRRPRRVDRVDRRHAVRDARVVHERGVERKRQREPAELAAVQRVRPLLHLFGHIHEDGGFWRKDGICFANVTTWDGGRKPTVFDLDAAARTIREISIPPARYWP